MAGTSWNTLSTLSWPRWVVLYYIPFTKLISFNKQFLDFAQNPMQNLDFAQNPMQNLDSAQNPTHAMRACADDSECLLRMRQLWSSLLKAKDQTSATAHLL